MTPYTMIMQPVPSSRWQFLCPHGAESANAIYLFNSVKEADEARQSYIDDGYYAEGELLIVRLDHALDVLGVKI